MTSKPWTPNRAFRILSAGLIFCLIVSSATYALLIATPPPAQIGHTGSPSTIKAWLDAYQGWSATSFAMARAGGLSLLLATAFGVALAATFRPRLVAFACFGLLNLYFAWTSQMLEMTSNPFSTAVAQAIENQANFLWTVLDLRIYLGVIPVVADVECLGLLIGVAVLTYLSNVHEGKGRASLISLQIAALSLVILGAEIAVFDYKEFYIHVTQLQASSGFMPWFSNADLLVSALIVLGTATLGLRLRTQR